MYNPQKCFSTITPKSQSTKCTETLKGKAEIWPIPGRAFLQRMTCSSACRSGMQTGPLKNHNLR